MTDVETRKMKAQESMAKSQASMTKALGEFTKVTESISIALAKMQHPAFAGMEVTGVRVSEDDISTSISLSNPDINGVTTIYRQDDGFLRIEILVEPEHSDRLMELIDVLPVNQFTLQAVELD